MTHDPVARLEHDHELLLRLVDGLRDSTQAALRGETEASDLRNEFEEFLRAAAEEIYEHFDREESVLFPYVLEQLPETAEVLDRLEAAHDRMCGVLGRLERLIANSSDDFTDELDGSVALFARFDASFVQHAREERDLIRTLAQGLTPTQREKVRDLLEGS